MTPNRIEAMKLLADNLRSEGQTSRADAVMELIHEVVRLQGKLAESESNAGFALDAAREDRIALGRIKDQEW